MVKAADNIPRKDPLAWRTKEAAAELGISARTLWELKRAGQVPFAQLNDRLTVYPVEELREWLKRKTVKPKDNGDGIAPADDEETEEFGERTASPTRQRNHEAARDARAVDDPLAAGRQATLEEAPDGGSQGGGGHPAGAD